MSFGPMMETRVGALLFLQEYHERGCASTPWREPPQAPWLKRCRMHVDGRDHYECMFILHLERHNIG